MQSGSGTERRYGGRTAAERRAERRERLLDAGLEQFATDGYAATTIEGLCAAASLNARYFYEQFRSREDLLGAVYERHAETVLRRVRGALDAVSDPRRRTETGLRAFVDATLADERAARVKYFEMVAVGPDLRAIRERTARRYVELIDHEAPWPSGPERSASESRRVAVALVGATDGLIVDWLMGDRTDSHESIVDTLLTVFGDTLG